MFRSVKDRASSIQESRVTVGRRTRQVGWLSAFVAMAVLAGQPGSAFATVTITTQPTSQEGCEGSTATFTVVATSTHDPISYEWSWWDSTIPGYVVVGADSPTLTVGVAGTYYCKLEDNEPSFRYSDPVTLTLTVEDDPCDPDGGGPLGLCDATCQAGSCSEADPVDCGAPTECEAGSCNPANGSCDSLLAPAGTQCTDTATGDCDDAQCDGLGACDQAYAYELDTYVCLADNGGGCDAAETCTGSSSACPGDDGVAPDTECRAALDPDCDVAETCDGSSDPCPAEGGHVTGGTPCTDTAQDDCDRAQCDGNGNCVQDQDVELNRYICRFDNLGGCDVAETCDGITGGACPGDVGVTIGDECRAALGPDCDAAETCDGSSNPCPVEGGHVGAGTPCGGGATGCSEQGTCDGLGTCDATHLVAGTECGDGPTDCSDQDTCDGSGTCDANDLVALTECGDDPTECSDQDTCDGSGTCDANDLVADTDCGAGETGCSDQDTCDGSGTCDANDFVAGTPCGSGATDCSGQDTCDGSGTCDANDLVADTPCDLDGLFCTNDTCDGAGTCVDGGDPCHPNATCTEAAAPPFYTCQCSPPLVGDGITVCQPAGGGGGGGGGGYAGYGGYDGGVTTDSDRDGVPNASDDCPDTAAGAEVNDDGCSCAQIEAQNGCDDGDACTTDTCSAGVCSHAGIDCEDDDACTDDACTDGICVNNPIDCDDRNPCTDDSCDPVAGCQNVGDDSNSCDDADACTTDACVGGACENTPLDCAEGQTCVDGQCVPGWLLEVGVTPAQAGRPVPPTTHQDGEEVQVSVPEAAADVDAVFVRWEGDVPKGQETADPLVLSMNANKNLTAVFQILTCIENADCEDGLFCNGTETCVDSECSAGESPCTASQTCDEDTDKCLTPARPALCAALGATVGLIFLGLLGLRFVEQRRRTRR